MSVGLLTWFGYAAIRAWQQSSAALADHRVKEGTDLFVTALARDMQGVQRSVLLSADLAGFERDPSHNTIDLVASGFARYPYPESFFAWRSPQKPALTTFFNRRDRPPQWASNESGPNRFPVVLSHHAQLAQVLLQRVQIDAALSRPFSVFEVAFAGTRYQVVARLLYRDALREQLQAVFGFTVNLAWVQWHYFPQLTDQVAHVAGRGVSVTLRMADRRDAQVSDMASATQNSSRGQRQFPMDFFDRLLVPVDLSSDLTREFVVVEAGTANDPSLIAANRGAQWLLGLGALAAGTVMLGFTLSLRATSTSVKLAELRSDFVSAVTHELKTPIATIRAIGETLLSGRIEGLGAQDEYARLVVQEAKRLTRFVDNLLAFSRITDVGDVYRFEPLSLDPLVKETLQEFSWQLTDEGFELALDVTPSLPSVVGDSAAIGLVLDNLIDNVIRYSRKGRWLGIRAHAAGRFVELEVSDRGPGIAEDEIPHLTRKFYRGRHAASGGSGLGLAIVQRIITAHGGTVAIRSTIGIGTTVAVSFRKWTTSDETANSSS